MHSPTETPPPRLLDGRSLRVVTETYEKMGTGGEIWPPSRALCGWLRSAADEVRGARVLELGSGTGVCGLFAASLGASHVLLTDDDRPALLDLARGNARLNAPLFPGCSVEVQPLVWGSTAPPAGPWDLVVGSDLTYVARGSEQLCQTIRELLRLATESRSSTRVVLAHQDRPVARGGSDGCLEEIVAIAEASGLRVSTLLTDPEPSWDMGHPVPIVVLELALARDPRLERARLAASGGFTSGGDFEAVPLPGGEELLLCTAPHEQAGTGGAVWQAATALCGWLRSAADEVRGARVLELGSGTGVCGLFAASLGASHVLLTDDDRPALLDLARGNARLNAPLFPGCSVEVQPLVWGSTAPPAGPWDLVVGSDLTHRSEGCELLCGSVRQLLSAESSSSPRVVLAHQDRAVEGTREQLEAVAAGWGLEVRVLLVDRDATRSYPPVPVAVLELCLRGGRAR